MATVFTKRVKAVLDFPRDIQSFVLYAGTIYTSMTNSAFFGALAARLAQLQTDITTLASAQLGFHSSPPTVTKALRDAALLVVQNDLRALQLDVQALADANHVQAEEIITAAGMKVKQQGAINKQNFVAKHGQISGTIELIAKGLRGRYANDWGNTNDGTNWIQVDPTLAAHTIVYDHTVGSILDFRHRYILKDGPTDWVHVDHVVVA
jgi:hypothetical protein